MNKHFINHILHKFFIQKIGISASGKIKEIIKKQIFGKPKTILDVSCGDDSLIFRLEQEFSNSICVANDISWKIISLSRNRHSKSKVIFTNHDIQSLPFRNKFDLIIFKNTLHHIACNKQDELIQNLSRISKQLIICDIDNPLKSSFLAKIWHSYYVNIMDDLGNNFLDFKQFKKKIKQNIKNKNVDFDRIKTIKGYYYYANIRDISSVKDEIEVEVKVKIEKNQIEKIKRKLKKNGFISSKLKIERDIYFTAPFRDFIKTKECLRIRSKKDFAEMTYKGKTNNDMTKKCQFWKKEFNISIDSEQTDRARQFLEALGFMKVVEVIKKRREFKLNRNTITIDEVTNGGLFMEIETMIDDKSKRKSAVDTNLKLLKLLGLENAKLVDKPYRDIVLNNKNQP